MFAEVYSGMERVLLNIVVFGFIVLRLREHILKTLEVFTYEEIVKRL